MIKTKKKPKQKQKPKQKKPPKNIKDKNIEKKNTIKESKIKSSNKINTNSNDTSINQSYSKIKSKSKNKEKSKKEEDSKSQIKKDDDLIKKQYKIIKDFLTPILKEENARQLVSCYSKQIVKEKNPVLKTNKNSSLKKRAILDYSFVTGNSNNKIKIPLFQILYPSQYKKHEEKKLKENETKLIKRGCRHFSAPNIKFSKSNRNKKLSNPNNIFLENKQNKNISKNYKNIVNKIKNKNNIEESKSTSSSINKKKAITPPLYLRIKDIQQQHNDEIDRLKKKYEYKNNDNSSKLSESENEYNKSRNKSFSPNNFEKWYNYEKTWQKIKNIKLNLIKNEIEENKLFMNKEIKDEETFKPKINKKSIALVNKKYDGDFYLRLKNYQQKINNKRKMLKKNFEPSFKPYINTNFQIKREYYDYIQYDQKLINRDLNYFLE